MAASKRAETGITVPEIYRGPGISSATFYKRRAKFGGRSNRGVALLLLVPMVIGGTTDYLGAAL